MTRYDFPNIDIAIRRAAIRAKRRNQPTYVYRTHRGFTITFTEPLPGIAHIKIYENGETERRSS